MNKFLEMRTCVVHLSVYYSLRSQGHFFPMFQKQLSRARLLLLRKRKASEMNYQHPPTPTPSTAAPQLVLELQLILIVSLFHSPF